MISANNGTRQPTVLLVEDDELVRDLMVRFLVREGYLVETAATGREAMRALRAPLAPIDVVVLDVQLPDVSGIDLTARLRQDNPHLPVIVCTGRAEPEEVAQLLKLGVRRYFSKPISMDELLASVEAALP